jgi:ParB family chromosome partitioning protein
MARLNLKDRLERVSRGESRRPFDLFAKDAVTFSYLPLGDIAPDPGQPRKDLGDLEGLKASIAAHGILQPLVVSPDPAGGEGYLLIAGERRYSAAKDLGMDTAPALVRTAEEHQRLELQLIENLHRKDLNPVEEAQSYRRLIEEFGLTQEQVAQQVGKSRPVINETLRILDLPRLVLEECRTSDTAPKSVLLEIAKRESPEEQLALWDQARRGELTVKKARAVKRLSRSDGGTESPGLADGFTPDVPQPAQHAAATRTIQTEKARILVAASLTPREIIAELRQAIKIVQQEQERKNEGAFGEQ